MHMNHVVDKTPVGRSFKNMCAKDRQSLKVKFNSAYHLDKWERPFSDFSDLLRLRLKNNVTKQEKTNERKSKADLEKAH